MSDQRDEQSFIPIRSENFSSYRREKTEKLKRDRYIRFTEHKKPDASILLEIELNNPSKLNVLNQEIIFSLNRKIREWKDRKELSALFIHSAGEKAFCAGGDVAQIYSSILESKKKGQDPALPARDFFQTEYETDYMLYQLWQPVVLWGSGIVMGGGLGLFMASSHPIVTETSLLAMPEVSIGFFPDVGASYFLNRIPKDFGRYLALTACRLNASEACFLNLTSWACPQREKQNVFDFLLESSFKNKTEFHSQFKKFYKEPPFLNEQKCWIKNFQGEIEKALEFKDLQAFYSYFSKAELKDKKWEKNRQNFLRASPSSLALVFEQLKRAKSQKDLKSLFEMEAVIALRVAQGTDFLEGVRALLIEKTKDPKWNPPHVEDLNPSKTDEYFATIESLDSSLRV